MKRVNKYLYLYIVQGNYGDGWEDVTAADNWKEALGYLKDYRDNEAFFPHRMIQRRELNPEYKETTSERTESPSEIPAY